MFAAARPCTQGQCPSSHGRCNLQPQLRGCSAERAVSSALENERQNPLREGSMTDSLHPVASHHLPSFITAPGETDFLMVLMAVILAFSVLGFGIVFFRLHTLPERMAHRSHKLQFEIVAVL